ncbi:MAG: PQQ-dependent sugar dehydrogenase [Gammaproteobacteria bacterium]|nr:PQQ-dependent sugar dehydrogenase [Gammaproteobacteria bacterium]
MARSFFALAAAGLLLSALAPTPVSAQSGVIRSLEHDYRVATVADGLIRPWSMAWLPNGDMLITERPGRLRIVRDGNLLPDPVPGVPEVFAQGQGGLFDVLPHPDFASNNVLFISYAKPVEGGSTTSVLRGTFANDTFTPEEEIFLARSQGRGHYGARLAFHPDGTLFVTVGDRQAPPSGDLEAHPAQDPSNHHGTTNRINEDGSVPADNPFVNSSGIRPEIWAWGHRNAQGLAIDMETGAVWQTEHGPQGGDELNLVAAGENYGWPVVGYGVNYRSGLAIHKGTMDESMADPSHVWVPSIGASGLMLYTGDAFPRWKGDIFAGGMALEQLARLVMDGEMVQREETLVYGMGRVRDVRQGPDGLIYLAIDHRDAEPTPVLRLEPADGR